MIATLKTLNIITEKGELNKKAVSMIQRHPELLDELLMCTSFMPSDTPVNVRLKLVKDGVTNIPTCANSNCNKLVPYKMAKSRFDTYCSPRCYQTDPQATIKHQEIIRNKYGVDNISAIAGAKERRAVTIEKIYGTTHQMHNADVKERVALTKLERDPDNIASSTKRRATNESRYGASTFAGSMIPLDVRSKLDDRDWMYDKTVNQLCTIVEIAAELGVCTDTIRTRMQTHGIDVSALRWKMFTEMHALHSSAPFSDTIYNPDWMRAMVAQKWTAIEIAQIANCSYTSVLNWSDKHGVRNNIHTRSITSSYELELRSYIQSIYKGNVEYSNRSIISPRELDIVLPDLNIAIEMNGMTYHSEHMGGRDSGYHIGKHVACESVGYRLIQIWGCEWTSKRSIVESRLSAILGTCSTIHARKCTIKELTHETYDTFFTKNHIQGSANCTVAYGLYHQDELVAAISFGVSRFGSPEQYELIRYCNKLFTTVVGGASKLFKHFIREHSPTSILTYSNRRWNTGNMYLQLGFNKVQSSKPGYYYFHTSNPDVLYHRMQFQKHKLAKILPKYDSDKTEFDNMVENGYDRIWDCGNEKYIWIPG